MTVKWAFYGKILHTETDVDDSKQIGGRPRKQTLECGKWAGHGEATAHFGGR